MQKTIAVWAAALATLAWAGALQAHHSGYMYATTPVWVKGTVVGVERVNPHTVINLEDTGEDGQMRRWAVEGPGLAQIERMRIGMDVPQVGDVVQFCAFPYRSAAELSRIFPGVDFSARRLGQATDGSARQFVAGHVMMTADGEKRFWEPHGLISECIRNSNEPRRSWLDFLNSSPRARDGWCEQRRYAAVQSSESLQEFVAEIDGLIDRPCA